jgi:hypothetical protein
MYDIYIRDIDIESCPAEKLRNVIAFLQSELKRKVGRTENIDEAEDYESEEVEYYEVGSTEHVEDFDSDENDESEEVETQELEYIESDDEWDWKEWECDWECTSNNNDFEETVYRCGYCQKENSFLEEREGQLYREWFDGEKWFCNSDCLDRFETNGDCVHDPNLNRLTEIDFQRYCCWRDQIHRLANTDIDGIEPCWGCRNDIANQEGHMGLKGCLCEE